MSDIQVKQIEGLAIEVLGPNLLRFQTHRLELQEDFLANRAKVLAQIHQLKSEEEREFQIHGEGVGLVDAYFDALLNCFAQEYVTLNALSILDFRISMKTLENHGRHTDARALAILHVKNSDRHEYGFSHESGSVSQSTVGVVQEMFQFFVNCERAYVQMHCALEDAQKRARSDLVQKYQLQMSTLVKATSYHQIAGRFKKTA